MGNFFRPSGPWTLYMLAWLFLGLLGLAERSHAQTGTWQSDLVHLDPETGALSYAPEPSSGIRIPDFSRAGYRGGSVPIPEVPTLLMIQPISGDNTTHIQNAIDSISALPPDQNGFRGALLLGPGVYPVYGTLRMPVSGVILRGSGRDSDTLTNTHILGLGNTPADRIILEMGGGDATQFAGMVPGTKTDIISPLVAVGDQQFRVADPGLYKPGDNIIIYHPCTEAWLEAVDGGGTGADASWTPGSLPILFNTRITAIKCDTVVTNSPVFNTLDSTLSRSYIYRYDRDGLVEHIGLENLRIDIEFDPDDPDDDHHARTAVRLTQVENAWVKGCEFRYFWFAGIDMRTANYVTVEDCRALSPKGPTTGGKKYNFCVSNAVQNTLFTKCVATEGRHAFVSNGTSSVAGVVFHHCTSIDPFTSSEGHRRWTTGLLFDNFNDYGNYPSAGRALGLYNRGSYGTGHGWSSANSVAWNCDVRRTSGANGAIVVQRPPTAQNFAIGCRGVITGNGPFNHPAGYIEGSNAVDSLVPHSLYEAQLTFRKDRDSITQWLAIDAHTACDSFVWIDGITYTASTDQPSFVLTDTHGCDSIELRLDLVIHPIDTSVMTNGPTLTANATDATYQWVDCEDGWIPVPGATDQSWTATTTGSYAVVINQNGCQDTSACIPVTLVRTTGHIPEIPLRVYPNPTRRSVWVDLGHICDQAVVRIYSSLGQIVASRQLENTATFELDLPGDPGIYLMELTTLKGEQAYVVIRKE